MQALPMVVYAALVALSAPTPENLDEQLLNAVEQGRTAVIQSLLSKGADANAEFENGVTALMIAALEGQHAVVQSLLDYGAKINEKAKNGNTALIAASSNGRTNIARTLLRAGAKVNSKSKSGLTALEAAFSDGHRDTMLLLIDEGAKANDTIFLMAAHRGYADVVYALIETGADVNANISGGLRPLSMAASEGHTEVVRVLLDHGAKVDARRSKTEATALISAVDNGHADTVNALIDAGANPNATRGRGKSALMLGAAKGYTEIVRDLVRAGASLNAESEDGWTAIKLAKLYQRKETANALKEFGARDLDSSNEIATSSGFPTTPNREEPYRILDGSRVKPPVLRDQVHPQYTKEALDRKVQGTVVLEVVILRDGTVGPIRVLTSLDVGLDLNAIAAVRKWSFLPGTLDGKPVDVFAEILVDFTISGYR